MSSIDSAASSISFAGTVGGGASGSGVASGTFDRFDTFFLDADFGFGGGLTIVLNQA